jgi:hypothetical protein
MEQRQLARRLSAKGLSLREIGRQGTPASAPYRWDGVDQQHQLGL